MTRRPCLIIFSFVLGLLLPALQSPAVDPQTVLLIHSNTTDNSTVFTDSSPQNHSITAVGNVKHSTAQTLFGKTSIYFDGSGDYLQLADSDDWYLDQGDWTIDFWMLPDDATARGIFGQSQNPNSTPLFFMAKSSTGQLAYSHYYIYYYTVMEPVTKSCLCVNESCPCRNQPSCDCENNCTTKTCNYTVNEPVQHSITYNENFTTANSIIAAGQWQHIAIVRQGTTITLYGNGTAVGTKTVAVDYNQNAPLLIGRDGKNPDFKGYMTEFRISKGVARWTTNFTPPTGAYDGPAADFASGVTSLIAGQSTTLSWSSTNASTCTIEPGIGGVTLSGSLSVSPADTTTYTLTADGSAGIVAKQATVQVVYPMPVVTISANPVSIAQGQSTVLTWNSQYAKTAGIEPGIGAVPVNGSQTVTPPSTTIYTITVTNPTGTAQASVTVGTFTDADSDTLPDDWEQSYFWSLNEGPDDDYDGDLLTNKMEFNKGTNPIIYNEEDVALIGLLNNGRYHSGNKIIASNCSIAASTNVLFKANCTIHIWGELHVKAGALFRIVKPGDCDWLPDEWEMGYFGTLTYGNNDDPDGDGLTNYQEYVFKADPTSFDNDTDNDDLNDLWEVAYFGHLHYGRDADPDGDGFSNYVEMVGSSNPTQAASKPKPGTYYEYDALGRIKKIYKVK